jgi:hypothetical protein
MEKVRKNTTKRQQNQVLGKDLPFGWVALTEKQYNFVLWPGKGHT